ncbi:MAG: pilin [Nanoarchaeota archaeon]|nr:pilin [Nanoarchaeota archaeon]
MKSIIFLLFLLLPSVFSLDFNQELSDEDKETFDTMLTPIMKIYNFIKYAATVIAVLALVFVGVQFMTSGSEQKKRDDAKTTGGYVIIGLFVIWVAPIVINYVIS